MSTNNGLIFARVQSKTKAQRNKFNGWDYTLSNGARMFLPNPNLKIGTWNFFEVSMDKFKTMHYVSHCPLSTTDGEDTDRQLSDLKMQSHEVNKFWRALDTKERECVMRTIGIGVTSFGAIGMSLSAVGTIAAGLAAECAATACTGGISAVVSLGLAGLSYLQYEELKKALAGKMDILETFEKKRTRFATSLQMHCPTQYKNLELFDPQVEGLVLRMKLIFDDFSFSDLFEENEDNLHWYGAPA